MDKNKILETTFDTIKDSTEWGIDEESKVYGHWIDGVVTVVGNILDDIAAQKEE